MAMAMTAKYVVSSKPNTAGAVYFAPTTATLPTDASTALSDDFKSLGHISEDGISQNGSANLTNIKSYGGSIVAVIDEGTDLTFTFTPLEYRNEDVQKLLNGSANVTTGTAGTPTEVKIKDGASGTYAVVFEHVLSDGSIERDVLPSASVVQTGSLTYGSSNALGGEVTVTPFPDTSNVKVYKYWK